MFEDKVNIFKEVIRLSRKVSNDEKKYEGKVLNLGFTDEDLEEMENPKSNSNILKGYLLKQDFETVKIISTIMYLGRDRDYDKNDSPEVIYRKEREFFDKDGWNDKEIEVYQVIDKGPLDIYLLNGLKILNVNLSI